MKIIGSVSIMLSGITLGWSYGQNIEYRYRELVELYRCFQIMYSDISYGGISFVEVLCHVQEQSLDVYRRMFSCMEEEMRKKTQCRFCLIWDKTVDNFLSELHLLENDVMELKRVGQTIGTVDKEQQLSMIQLYLRKLELEIGELEREKDKKIKLCRMLGAMGSIFVVVILL